MYDDYDPSDFYNERPECKDCLEKEQMFDEASEYLEEIVQQLYSKDPINYSDLEHCLDELCHYLKVKTIPGDLTICRKQEELKLVVPRWLNAPDISPLKTIKTKIA